MASSTRTKLLACALAPPAALAALELGVRIAGCAPPERTLPIHVWRDSTWDDGLLSGGATHRFCRGWLWEPRPGARFHGEQIGDGAHRGPSYPIEPRPTLRILALGESATFGMAGSEADSWPRQLETLLRGEGIDVQVLNFGIIGQTLAQGVEHYVRGLRAWRADVVVVCFGGRNELSDVGTGASDREKIGFFDSPALRLRMCLDDLACVRWLAQPKAPRADGGAAPYRPRVSADEYDELVQRLVEECRRDGARVAWVLPPFESRAEARVKLLPVYRDRIRASVASRDVPLADVVATVRAREARAAAEGTPVSLFADAAHPNAEGARLFAETIGETLREAGWIPD